MGEGIKDGVLVGLQLCGCRESVRYHYIRLGVGGVGWGVRDRGSEMGVSVLGMSGMDVRLGMLTVVSVMGMSGYKS